MRKYLVNSVESLSEAGLRLEVSSFGRRPYFVFRELGGAVGAIAMHIDDILGRGAPDLPKNARRSGEGRLGKLKVQEESSVRAGAELGQEDDFSATLTQEGVTKNAKFLPRPRTCARVVGTFVDL